MQPRINNYNFDMDAMTSFEGDTGPYLQYAHARLCSIKRRANLPEEDLASANLSLLQETHAMNVVRMLGQWPDVVQNTLKTQEPTTVLTYLFKMTHVVSSSYDHLQVVGSERELMKARMVLYDATRLVLANGMRLLGLTPLERYVEHMLLAFGLPAANSAAECEDMPEEDRRGMAWLYAKFDRKRFCFRYSTGDSPFAE